jgi:hypothetical protein
MDGELTTKIAYNTLRVSGDESLEFSHRSIDTSYSISSIIKSE